MTQDKILDILWKVFNHEILPDVAINELELASTSKPNVSGELLFDSKCCANCKHFIDKWPYKSECNFHGNKANITHTEEQCCDNWEKL